ncbi:sirohydrochlorin cobaltochelatase [Peptacetobacter sp.]|uniref:sirohydrochlorin cobaltochelatase n=1 Tax=Peptacetobacter sp. TaxID=2991975 RepID=UPI00260B493E|nr:sirohydrochlorin cobaltochelatase [Peptacetobacter sp.]
MKKAVLVVSFGTSYHETREKTINAVENKIKEDFKEYDFFRAYTSNMIINKLKRRDNIEIDNPIQAMERIYKSGYDEVVVQTLHIICGHEYVKLKEQIKEYKDKFKSIKFGNPLLYSIEDYKYVASSLKEITDKMDSTVVLMGHGTDHESHSAYPAIEYYLRDLGADVYVGTVEGYPEIDNVIKKLKERNIKKVHLMPFMLVAGDHAQNDMAGDEEDSWKNIIESENIETVIHLKGLGEMEKIQNKFVENAKKAEEI